jgi:hypothetical protein
MNTIFSGLVSLAVVLSKNVGSLVVAVALIFGVFASDFSSGARLTLVCWILVGVGYGLSFIQSELRESSRQVDALREEIRLLRLRIVEDEAQAVRDRNV